MIAYTVVGTNDLDRATTFYDELLAEIGGKQAMNLDGIVLYAGADGTPFFCVARPYDGKEATVGNGSMVSFAAENPDAVDKLYAKAISLGGSDEGAPGKRSRGGLEFYAGYFRDLDGNKLNFFCM
jgi:catechol 2,3-dioxygenase-like lactoylglutathione lyase family enzyme